MFISSTAKYRRILPKAVALVKVPLHQTDMQYLHAVLNGIFQPLLQS